MDELKAQFDDKTTVQYRLFPIFDNALQKLDQQWQAKGGRVAYNQHVLDIVNRFGHLPVHPNVWLDSPPCSSTPAHLYACAIASLINQEQLVQAHYTQFVWTLRAAFFGHAEDISQQKTIRNHLEELALPIELIEAEVNSGKAYALLGAQARSASEQNVKVSPTLVLNEGRQIISGNVGYRIIEANVRELITHPEIKQSWC
jgi:hypothetical protein